jgi:argininosuccinate lyase
MTDSSKSKLWGGRFSALPDPEVERFTASVECDKRLSHHDIQGSIAHATMLASVGVLSTGERDAIVEGLRTIESDIQAGRFRWSDELEDVHMNVEAALTERVGSVGKKLHTGRSRNDQVATDMRLYLREQTDQILALLAALQQVLVDLAETHAETIMPGFTHMQVAQPITFGHHLLAWYEMLARDHERYAEGRARINRSPLGAAALAGTSFPIDRALTTKLLEFDSPCDNSLDAVSDRDFLVEFAATSALLMVHLSRMCEELILWSSAQFGFIELSDAFTTGSSIMPQKKNPDVAELTRGKSGRVIGNLMALLTLMKGQPLAYNRDNQEDKEPLFDTAETVTACLKVFTGMLPSMTVHVDAMRVSAARGFPTATDLADYLVRKNVPFRDAHEMVGMAVRYASERQSDLADLSLEELRGFCEHIDADVFEVLTLEGAVAARSHAGGTAPERVREATERARQRLRALVQTTGTE